MATSVDNLNTNVYKFSMLLSSILSVRIKATTKLVCLHWSFQGSPPWSYLQSSGGKLASL